MLKTHVSFTSNQPEAHTDPGKTRAGALKQQGDSLMPSTVLFNTQVEEQAQVRGLL